MRTLFIFLLLFSVSFKAKTQEIIYRDTCKVISTPDTENWQYRLVQKPNGDTVFYFDAVHCICLFKNIGTYTGSYDAFMKKCPHHFRYIRYDDLHYASYYIEEIKDGLRNGYYKSGNAFQTEEGRMKDNLRVGWWTYTFQLGDGMENVRKRYHLGDIRDDEGISYENEFIPGIFFLLGLYLLGVVLSLTGQYRWFYYLLGVLMIVSLMMTIIGFLNLPIKGGALPSDHDRIQLYGHLFGFFTIALTAFSIYNLIRPAKRRVPLGFSITGLILGILFQALFWIVSGFGQ